MAPSLAPLIDRYLHYFAAGASHTARAKRLDVSTFVAFLVRYRAVSSLKELTWTDWDHASIERFIDDRLALGEAPATVARRLATLKHMGRMLAERESGFQNPARDIKSPRLALTRPRALSAEEQRAVEQVATARQRSRAVFSRARNAFLLEFLLATGMRADECRTLTLDQIDESHSWINNVRSKGRRFRTIYISSQLRQSLEAYLKLRTKELQRFYGSDITHAQSGALPLFVSGYRADPARPESFRLGSKTVWRAIRELSADTKIHPHILRHSFATNLLDSSHDIRLVSQALGHSDVRVTMRYTERRDEEVARAIEAMKGGKTTK